MIMQRAQIIDDLQVKLKALNDALWEDKAKWPHVEKWLSQFEFSNDLTQDEQVQVLFLASHFMYFGIREIRALLRSLFRDLIQYKSIQDIRRRNGNTRNRTLIADEFRKSLSKT